MGDFRLIPVARPLGSCQRHGPAILAAINRVLDSGTYILGAEVGALEHEFAAWAGTAHCCGVASGTDALSLALVCVGIRPGDEVITVSHTSVATVVAIERVGAIPVFVDIDPRTRCIDPQRVEDALSPATRALLPVHLYGQPAPMLELMDIAARHRLVVVEDCAQAHGAAIGQRHVGTFGHAAAFSFYPTKNLGGMGDGGAVLTASGRIDTLTRKIRQYGWGERRCAEIPGFNSRLDEIQAAVLRVKLPFLEADNERRRSIAAAYTAALHDGRIRPPAGVAGTTHAMHLYVVETDAPQELGCHLARRGIATGLHYALPVHLQPAYVNRVRGCDSLPDTEQLCKRIVTLPMFPELTDDEVLRICDALRDF